MKQLIQSLLAVLVLAAGAALAAPVNVNSADAATLARALTGIGMARAEAIVAYREENGRFETVEDLLRVQGIGPAILDANREQIRLEEHD